MARTDYTNDCCKLADQRGYERGRKERLRHTPPFPTPIVPESQIGTLTNNREIANKLQDIAVQLERIADMVENVIRHQHWT